MTDPSRLLRAYAEQRPPGLHEALVEHGFVPAVRQAANAVLERYGFVEVSTTMPCAWKR